MKTKATFESEAAMCAAFIAMVPPEWVAYPETGGFDILLVRREDGFQIGIEAKLALNAKVISQVSEAYWDVCREGPDCRAVLVPEGAGGSFVSVCALLGITVLAVHPGGHGKEHRRRSSAFRPDLPTIEREYWNGDVWHEWAPVKRIVLPDYVPDVGAGSSAPVKLTEWKVKAIKVCVLLARRGVVTRHDFKALSLNHRRWITPGIDWLVPGPVHGTYRAGPFLPDLRTQHPRNFEEIAADFDRWAPPPTVPAAMQEVML